MSGECRKKRVKNDCGSTSVGDGVVRFTYGVGENAACGEDLGSISMDQCENETINIPCPTNSSLEIKHCDESYTFDPSDVEDTVIDLGCGRLIDWSQMPVCDECLTWCGEEGPMLMPKPKQPSFLELAAAEGRLKRKTPDGFKQRLASQVRPARTTKQIKAGQPGKKAKFADRRFKPGWRPIHERLLAADKPVQKASDKVGGPGEEKVSKGPEKYYVVKFWSTSCGICGKMAHYDKKVTEEEGAVWISCQKRITEDWKRFEYLAKQKYPDGRLGFPTYIVAKGHTPDTLTAIGSFAGGMDKGAFRKKLKAYFEGNPLSITPEVYDHEAEIEKFELSPSNPTLGDWVTVKLRVDDNAECLTSHETDIKYQGTWYNIKFEKCGSSWGLAEGTALDLEDLQFDFDPDRRNLGKNLGNYPYDWRFRVKGRGQAGKVKLRYTVTCTGICDEEFDNQTEEVTYQWPDCDKTIDVSFTQCPTAAVEQGTNYTFKAKADGVNDSNCWWQWYLAAGGGQLLDEGQGMKEFTRTAPADGVTEKIIAKATFDDGEGCDINDQAECEITGVGVCDKTISLGLTCPTSTGLPGNSAQIKAKCDGVANSNCTFSYYKNGVLPEHFVDAGLGLTTLNVTYPSNGATDTYYVYVEYDEGFCDLIDDGSCSLTGNIPECTETLAVTNDFDNSAGAPASRITVCGECTDSSSIGNGKVDSWEWKKAGSNAVYATTRCASLAYPSCGSSQTYSVTAKYSDVSCDLSASNSVTLESTDCEPDDPCDPDPCRNCEQCREGECYENCPDGYECGDSGDCEPIDLCENVSCDPCEQCINGECEENCPDGQECGDNGECVTKDPCENVDCSDFGPCWECVGGECQYQCADDEICDGGTCVPAPVPPCQNVECDECEECIGGECYPKCDEETENCIGGVCVPKPSDPCDPDPCLECEQCIEGECYENCPDGQSCGDDGTCVDDPVDPCDPDPCQPCEKCIGGECEEDCPDCEECGDNGECVPIECRECEKCEGNECVENCPDDEKCGEDGTCIPIDPCRDTVCDECQGCIGGECFDRCDPETEECIDGLCVPTSDLCKNVSCDECEKCVNGECLPRCPDDEICVEGICIEPGDPVLCGGNYCNQCQKCVDDVCVDLCEEDQTCLGGKCYDDPEPPDPEPFECEPECRGWSIDWECVREKALANLGVIKGGERVTVFPSHGDLRLGDVTISTTGNTAPGVDIVYDPIFMDFEEGMEQEDYERDWDYMGSEGYNYPDGQLPYQVKDVLVSGNKSPQDFPEGANGFFFEINWTASIKTGAPSQQSHPMFQLDSLAEMYADIQNKTVLVEGAEFVSGQTDQQNSNCSLTQSLKLSPPTVMNAAQRTLFRISKLNFAFLDVDGVPPVIEQKISVNRYHYVRTYTGLGRAKVIPIKVANRRLAMQWIKPQLIEGTEVGEAYVMKPADIVRLQGNDLRQAVEVLNSSIDLKLAVGGGNTARINQLRNDLYNQILQGDGTFEQLRVKLDLLKATANELGVIGLTKLESNNGVVWNDVGNPA